MNAAAAIGHNVAPLDHADDLVRRLELENAELFAEAVKLDEDARKLPKSPSTDEESGTVQDHVVAVKKLRKRIEDLRTTEGRPYLDATKALNALASDYDDPLGELAKTLTERVGIYAKAKAERERAERLERERLERERAEEERRKEEAARAEAARIQREADEAAAKIRKAKDAEAREAAEKEMREKEAAAAVLRKQAEAASEQAAKSERRADAAEKAAHGDVGKMSKVSAGGSTSSVSAFWEFHITDAEKLIASLGPLGPYLSNDTIQQAVGRAVREHTSAKTITTLKLPGVTITESTKTNISARR